MRIKNDTICVLDHGSVRLVHVSGGDTAVVSAARTCTEISNRSRDSNADVRLIRYLISHEHMTPFEFVNFTFHIKAPIFVARQWMRHRTASICELSRRSFRGEPEIYIPPTLTSDQRHKYLISVKDALLLYKAFLADRLPPEIARIVLPVSVYTEWHWNIDLRNLLHFLELRLDPASQREMREYAVAVERFVDQCVPVTHDAWSKKLKEKNDAG